MDTYSENDPQPTPEPCEYHEQLLLEWKMAFVGVLGLFTALFSIVNNCLLYYTFVTSRTLKKRRLTYLKWISLCDVFVSTSYIAIMCVQVYVDYFHSLFLFYMWHTYLVIAYTISHITFSSSSYLLMAATIERYLQTTANNRSTALFHCLRSHRAFVVLFCFLAGFVLRGTVFFEIEVQMSSECKEFASMWAAPTSLTSSPLFDKIWKFWIRKLLTVILPFVVLAYFNMAIVMNVRKSDRDQIVKTLILYVTVGPRGDSTRLSSRLRTVTRMLVIVVCTYLFSNVIDVIIAIMENLDVETLEAYPQIYTVASDISSFLPILACAIRPVIYATNDSIIAREIRRSFARLCGCSRHARELPELLAVHDSPSEKLTLEPRFGMGRLIMARAALEDPTAKHSFISVSSVLL